MSPTSTRPGPGHRRGFTLVEMVVAMAISSVVLAATLGAYTFLGRNLARLAGHEEQQSKARRWSYQFTQDVAASAGVSAASTTSLSLYVYVPSPSPSPPPVTYTFDEDAQTLKREDSDGKVTALGGVAQATFSCYDAFDQPVTSSPISITNVGLALTLASPASAGTGAPVPAINARVVLRNKPLLGDGRAMPTPTPGP